MQGDDASAPRIRLLGPIEVRAEGTSAPLRSRLQRLLLTVLALGANRTVAADRLIDELWGDQLPDDPAGSLRTQVSRLRRSVPALAIATEPSGYRLDVDPDDIDLRRFERLLNAAADRPDDAALGLIEEALTLWGGRPFDEFLDRAFAQVEQRRLEELHAVARERRVGLLLAGGHVAEAASAAELLLAEAPEREHARALLMDALYRLGRATAALDVYRSWNRELGERGLEPSPGLRAAEARILRHAVDTTTEAERMPVPRPASTLIGRDRDLLGVADLLETTRLVTLWGAGGVGKTRLALEVAATVADRYPDGVHVCDLTVLTAGSDVARAVARSVGMHERSGRRLEAQLVDRLAGRRMLLILDNCEHVLDNAAPLAQHLVQSTAGVDILATSRERLGGDGEHIWEVSPLDANGPGSPAVALFLDRAQATNPTFVASDDDLAAIVEVCHRLDGLPLAVQLGAARTRGLSPTQLLTALDARPEVLREGTAAPSRHRSLRAVLEWSYALLPAVEQRVFDRLAVFRGAFDLTAALAVTSGDDLDAGEAELAVLRLLDRALLVERAGAPNRYAMLDTVRTYGLEHLRAQGALDDAAGAHAHWVVALADDAALGLGGPDEAASAALIDDNLDELRAAHHWLVGHDVQGAARLVAALRPYALWRGHSEIHRWAEVTVAAASGIASPFLPDVLLAASTGAWQRGDLATARTTADSIPRAGPPARTRRAALEASADVALLAGELTRAVAEFTEAHQLAMAAGDHLQAVWDIGSAAVGAAYAGDTAAATQLAASASGAAEQCGSPSARAFAHFALGEILARADPAAAGEHLEEAIELSAAADSRFVTGLAEVALAALRGREHDVGVALAHCRSALERWHRAGAWTPLWVTMRTVIAVLTRAESFADATTLLAATQSARTGAPPFGADAATMQHTTGELRHALGDAYERHVESGRSMTEEDAVQFAIGALERASLVG